MSSRRKLVSLAKLNRDPAFGSVLVRLMMAVNDCALADESLLMWRERTGERDKVRRQEAIKYFVELQIAHLYEGLKVIKEIDRSPELKRYVDQSDRPTREEFTRLVAFLDDSRYEKLVGRVRNNITFHYSEELSTRVLDRLATQKPEMTLWASMGNSSADWLFEPGALVSEQIAVREIFKVPEGDNITEATDRIMVEVQNLANDFVRFAGHFVWQHTSS